MFVLCIVYGFYLVVDFWTGHGGVETVVDMDVFRTGMLLKFFIDSTFCIITDRMVTVTYLDTHVVWYMFKRDHYERSNKENGSYSFWRDQTIDSLSTENFPLSGVLPFRFSCKIEIEYQKYYYCSHLVQDKQRTMAVSFWIGDA